jgi:hypothetical protein
MNSMACKKAALTAHDHGAKAELYRKLPHEHDNLIRQSGLIG